ncbi:MAG: hypothetical protein KFB95_05955 [Simkaniaceae bacterium]|nr:MAG: hypothetical protein KFB95_05955 [Simkaniaceae bacterium]
MKKIVCLLGLFTAVALGSMYTTMPTGSKTYTPGKMDYPMKQFLPAG